MHVFDLMICSPDEVSLERQIIRKSVDFVNNMLSNQDTVLRVRIWENIPTQASERGVQDLINQEATSTAHIYVFIFSSGVGGTKERESGTAQELQIAVNRLNAAPSDIQILAFFKISEVDPLTADVSQIEALQSAKRVLEKQGIKYDKFSDDLNLQGQAIAAILNAATKLKSDAPAIKSTSGIRTKKESIAHAHNENNLEEEDLGILELVELTNKKIEAAAKSMIEITAETTIATNEMREWSEKVERFDRLGLPPQTEFINSLGDSFNRFSENLNSHCDSLETNLLSGLKDTGMLMSELNSFADENADIASLSDNIREAMVGTREMYESTMITIEHISKFPNLTTKIKKSKNGLLRSFNYLKEILSTAIELGDAIISILKPKN